MKYKCCKSVNGNPAMLVAECEKAEEGLNALLLDIFEEMGNGDMENGGKGSLWNCAPDIYACLEGGNRYSYANCTWWMEEDVEKPEPPRVWIFRYSAVADTSVTVVANSYEKAKAMAEKQVDEAVEVLKSDIDNGTSGFMYDMNLGDEGHEELPYNPIETA